jgi:hypothetical protein
MSPYQRAAAVAASPCPATGPVPVGRRTWPGRGDRVAQALLAGAVLVVLAAMTVNRLDVALDLSGTDRGAVQAAMRTWSLDALTLLGLAAVAVVHSLARRRRPGRWPVGVAVLVAAVSVVLVPALAA